MGHARTCAHVSVRKGRGELLAAALSLAAAAPVTARDWVEVKSLHFVVVSDAGEARARRVVTELEQVRALFERLTGVRLEPHRPLLVFAVKGEAAMRELTPSAWEGKGRVRPAGQYLSGLDRDYILLRTDLGSRSSSVVYHEYVHRLTAMSQIRFPTWLAEGLAGFLETLVVEGPNLAVGRISDENVRYLRARKRIPLAKLLAADRASPEYTSSTMLFYAQAAVLTHYLLLGPDVTEDSLGSLTRVLREGLVASPADNGGLGDVGALEKSVRAYIDGTVFRSRILPAEILEAPFSARPLSAGEVAAVKGKLLVAQGRWEARAALEEALRLEPRLSIAHEGMGRLSLSRGRAEEAVTHLNRALELDPQNTSASFYLALAHPWRSEARESALRRTIELAPDFGPALEYLADLLWARKERLDEAESLARRALELEPRSPSRRTTLAEVLRRAGRDEDALVLESDLRRQAMNDTGALAELARYYVQEERLPEAAALTADALAANPTNVVALQVQAGLMAKEKRFDEAEAAYRRALDLHPRSSRLMNALGYMNADRNVRVREALSLIDRALAADPTNLGYLDSRGWALFRLGRIAEAESVLRRALDQCECLDVLEHLGDVCHARGAVREGLAFWRRAAERGNVSDEDKERLTKKIRASEEAQTPSPPSP